MAKAPVNVGDILAGKYCVERVLGAGAMGVVVAARHTDLHELRALKFMLPSALGDAEGVERFLREARAAARLKSQHVAHVHDVGRLENGAPYIVMEYLEGRDLKSLLDERGRLSAAEAARIMLDACHALSEAHEAGIVHRDLKPANIYLSRGAGGATIVKLLDFGIAKVSDGGPGAGEMTSTSALLGTPLFMSPEQMRSTRNVDFRTDIWALGVILYRMLGGRLPFSGTTVTEICMSVVSDEPEPLENVAPMLPRGFGAIVARCLMKNAAARFTSVAELAGALEPYAREMAAPNTPIAAAPSSMPNPMQPSAAGNSYPLGGTHVMNQGATPQQSYPQQTYSQQAYPQQAYPQQGYAQQTNPQMASAIPNTIQSTVGAYTTQPTFGPTSAVQPAKTSNGGLIVVVSLAVLFLVGGIAAAAVFLLNRPGEGTTQTASTGVKHEDTQHGNGTSRIADANTGGTIGTTASTAETAMGTPTKTGTSPTKTTNTPNTTNTTNTAAPSVTGTDLPGGAACAKSDQCKSGFCVDRVCCDSACSDKCMACTVGKKGSGGKDGSCGWISGGRDPDRECGGGAKRCDGFGGCVTLTPEQIQSLGGK